MSFYSSARRRPTHTREIHSRHKRLARSAATPRPDTTESGPDLSSASPGGGEVLNSWRRATAAVAGLTLAFALASCTSDDKPAPTPSSTQAAPTAPATTAAPSWEDAYSPEQLAAYQEALGRLTAYEQKSEPIWAAGVVTPTAEKFFKEYFTLWQAPLADLEFYETNKLSRTGSLTVLTSEATQIKLSAKGGSMTVRQCTDPSTISISQDGKKVVPEDLGPQYRDVLFDLVNGRWFLLQIDESKGDRPCVG